MKRLGIIVGSAAVIICVTIARSQSQSDASLAGVITADDLHGRPIARAVVTLAGPAAQPSLVAIADGEGRFVFSNVTPGLFTLSASKTTYLTMAYGQATPEHGAGLPIAVSAGAHLTNLDWALPRGGVITGRVRDEHGQPMRDVPIVLMKYRTVDGVRTIGSATCCVWPVSGGDGAYRVFGIAPGDYLVSVVPPGQYVFIPSGPWSGGGREVRTIDPAEMRWALAQVGAPGAPARGQGSAEPPASPTMAYGRVYYPDTTDDRAATTMTIGAGEERSGVDVTMRLQRTARIEGRILGADGQPAVSPRVSMGGATSGGPNATFVFRNLLPGHYVMAVHAAGNTQSGTAEIDLNGQDVTDYTIHLEPSPTLSGRVVFESASDTATNRPAVRLSVRPSSPGGGSIAAATDGSFTLPTDPGRYRLNVALTSPGGRAGAAAGAGWMLRSATLNGHDIADEAFDVGHGDALSGIVVTLTDRVTAIAGTLRDATGQPAPGYYVVAFPTDRALWVPGSRRIPSPVRAATNGGYEFTALPAGRYCLVALTGVDATDLADASFLDHLLPSGVTVVLADGRRLTQDLKFAR